MPKGPEGQKRPGDVIGAAAMVAKIATGEIEERPSETTAAKREAGRRPSRLGAGLTRSASRRRPSTKRGASND